MSNGQEVNEARIEWIHDQLQKISRKIGKQNDLLHGRINERKKEIEELKKKARKIEDTAQHSAGIWGHVWEVVKYFLAAAGGVGTWMVRDYFT